LGFGVWGLGFGVWGLGVGGLGFGVWGLGVWGLGFGVWGRYSQSEKVSIFLNICVSFTAAFGDCLPVLRRTHKMPVSLSHQTLARTHKETYS
jgi:hypothetical protein